MIQELVGGFISEIRSSLVYSLYMHFFLPGNEVFFTHGRYIRIIYKLANRDKTHIYRTSWNKRRGAYWKQSIIFTDFHNFSFSTDERRMQKMHH